MNRGETDAACKPLKQIQGGVEVPDARGPGAGGLSSALSQQAMTLPKDLPPGTRVQSLHTPDKGAICSYDSASDNYYVRFDGCSICKRGTDCVGEGSGHRVSRDAFECEHVGARRRNSGPPAPALG